MVSLITINKQTNKQTKNRKMGSGLLRIGDRDGLQLKIGRLGKPSLRKKVGSRGRVLQAEGETIANSLQ